MKINSLPISASTYFPCVIWGLAATFYAYEFFVQVSPSVMTAELMHAFSANATQLGSLGAVWFYAYAFMQIPVGVLVDHFGARRLLTIAALCCGLSCLIFSSAHSLWVAGAARFCIGLGSAFAAISCMHLAATWFAPNKFALLTGLLLSIGMLGAVGGEAPLALLMIHFSWRSMLCLFAAVGFLLCFLCWLIIRDRPLSSKHQMVHALYETHFLSGLRYVLRHKTAWLLSLYAGFMFAPTPAFTALWGVPFLVQAYHITPPVAATLVSMLFVGWIIGSPLFGWFSDRIGRRLPPLWIASVGGLISLLSVLYLPGLHLWIVATLLWTFGFFSSAFLPVFALMRENHPPEANATSLGFMNMMNTVGAAAAQPLVGMILDYYWNGAIDKYGAPLYSTQSFHIAMALLPASVFCGLCMLPWIRETYCQSVVE